MLEGKGEKETRPDRSKKGSLAKKSVRSESIDGETTARDKDSRTGLDKTSDFAQGHKADVLSFIDY